MSADEDVPDDDPVWTGRDEDVDAMLDPAVYEVRNGMDEVVYSVPWTDLGDAAVMARIICTLLDNIDADFGGFRELIEQLSGSLPDVPTERIEAVLTRVLDVGQVVHHRPRLVNAQADMPDDTVRVPVADPHPIGGG